MVEKENFFEPNQSFFAVCTLRVATNKHLSLLKKTREKDRVSDTEPSGCVKAHHWDDMWISSKAGLIDAMGTKMKALLKGFKYISQIFVYKEHEMEIGYPTDVRHVAHIGWDSSSVNAPTWMNEFKTESEFSSNSLGNFGQSRETSWASQDFDQTRGLQQHSGINSVDAPCPEIPKAPKKTRQKMARATSPPSVRSSRTSRSQGSYATAIEDFEEIGNGFRIT